MKATIQLINQGDILIREFEGQINFTEILESWEYLINNNYLANVIGVINDFRNANLIMEIDNLSELMGLFKNNYTIFSRIKLAVIMEKPENFVLPVYAEMRYPDFKIKAFSTEEAAISWIGY